MILTRTQWVSRVVSKPRASGDDPELEWTDEAYAL